LLLRARLRWRRTACLAQVAPQRRGDLLLLPERLADAVQALSTRLGAAGLIEATRGIYLCGGTVQASAVLSQIVLEDAKAAQGGSSPSRVVKVAVASAGVLAALTATIGLLANHAASRRADELTGVATTVAHVAWGEPARPPEDFERLERLRRATHCERSPEAAAALHVYHAALDTILTAPVTQIVAARLTAGASGGDADTLAAYLMLADPARVDPQLLAAQLLPPWREALRARRSLVADPALAPHLATLADDLQTGAHVAIAIDPGVVARARARLRPPPEVDARLLPILAEARAQIPALTLAQALGSTTVALTPGPAVPGCYTPEGWEYLRTRLRERESAVSRESWILGDAAGAASSDRAIRRYLEDYRRAWLAALAGTTTRRATDLRQGLHDLDELLQARGPIPALLELTLQKTTLAEIAPSGANTTLARLRDRLPGAAVTVAAEPTPTARLAQAFAGLRDLMQPTDAKSESALSQYLAALARVRDAVRDHVENGAELLRVAAEIAAAHDLCARVLLQIATAELREAARPLFEGPIASLRAAVARARLDELSAAWTAEVSAPLRHGLVGRYPFSAHAPDAPLDQANELLRPGGTLWGFYQARLAGVIERRGKSFAAARGHAGEVREPTLRCLALVQKWTDLLFAGRAEPGLAIAVRPLPVGPGVSELELEIEGQRHVYRNGPDERWQFAWPGGAHGVRVAIVGKAGLLDQASWSGEWALFHFFDQAVRESGVGPTRRFAWQLPHGQTVRLEVTAPRPGLVPAERPALACPQGLD
jgi:type VI secretion system protein ImpL